MTTWMDLSSDLQRAVVARCCEPTRDAWLQVSKQSALLIVDVRQQEARWRKQYGSHWHASPLPSFYELKQAGCNQAHFSNIARQLADLADFKQDLWHGWYQRASKWQQHARQAKPYVWLHGLVSYQGPIYRHQPHGFGLAKWCDGSWYQGDWLHGMFEGIGVYCWPEGQGQYEGQWSQHKLHGQGMLRLANGTLVTGLWHYHHCIEITAILTELFLRSTSRVSLSNSACRKVSSSTPNNKHFQPLLQAMARLAAPNDIQRTWSCFNCDNNALFWHGAVWWP